MRVAAAQLSRAAPAERGEEEIDGGAEEAQEAEAEVVDAQKEELPQVLPSRPAESSTQQRVEVQDTQPRMAA